MKNHTPGLPGGICKFPECGLDYYSLGYCIGHYRQHKRGTELRPLRRREATLEDRFWVKVNKTDMCWLWTGSQIRDGYGRIGIDGKLHLAHRVSFTWANGPIPDGMLIDHKCHQPSCVRPDHLRLATVRQNQEHRSGATRASSTNIRGVFAHDGQRFRAQIKAAGTTHYLGLFDTAEEAEAVVKAKRLELFTHSDMDRV